MAARIVTLRLKDGTELLAEIDEPASEATRRAGIGDTKAIDFASAVATIRSAAEQLRESLTSLSSPPESYEVSFGIKLSASAGVILAKAGTEANFTIKLGWKKKD